MAARKPPNRTTDDQINIRMTAAEKATLLKAAQKLVEHVPGAKVSLSGWLLDLGLTEARRILTHAEK